MNKTDHIKFVEDCINLYLDLAEENHSNELKKDLETLTNEQIAGIRNLAQRYKETHGHD